MYTTEEKKEIDRILSAFQDYIDHGKNVYQQPDCEVVWLDKLQCYLYVTNTNETDEINQKNLDIVVVDSAETLCWEFVFDIVYVVYDIYLSQDLPWKNITEELVEQMKKDMLKQLQPYLEQLPEYQELAMDVIAERIEQYKKNYYV